MGAGESSLAQRVWQSCYTGLDFINAWAAARYVSTESGDILPLRKKRNLLWSVLTGYHGKSAWVVINLLTTLKMKSKGSYK